MSNPLVGLGTSFEFATTLSPTVFTPLVGVTSVAFTGDKVATEKTTNMQTTNGVDTYIASTQEPGTVDVKATYEPGEASQVALETIRAAAVAVPFKVLYPLSLGSRTFTGIVESATVTLPLDKLATIDYKIKISGPVTTA